MNNPTNGWGKKPTSSTATNELKEAVKAGKTKKLTFEVPEEMHKKFKMYATEHNTDMAKLLNTFIQQTINK